jgi:MFS family permease
MRRRTTRRFYGWWIVGSAFLTLFTTVGIGLYVPPVFLVPLQDHFGWSRAAIAAGTGVAALIAAIGSPLAGMWIDTYGARKVMVGGAVLMGGAFALLGTTGSLWQLYVFNGLAAFGLTCAAWVPNQTLVSSWFEQKRGLAMGVALTGIGFGGLVMAPVAAWLIAEIGWRLTFAVLGGIILTIVAPVVLLIVRSHPSDLGLLPDGDPPQRSRAAVTSDSGQTDAEPAYGVEFAVVIRTSDFWILALCNLLSAFASLSIVGHLVAFLSDAGMEARSAAAALGLTVGASVGGRLLFGLLSDRLPKRHVTTLAFVGHALGVLLLLNFGAAGVLPAFVLTYGVALGGAAVLMPLLVGECFGLLAFGKILGLTMLAATLGAAVGPILTGHIFDVTGSYRLAFTLHMAAFLMAAVAVQFLSQPEHARL